MKVRLRGTKLQPGRASARGSPWSPAIESYTSRFSDGKSGYLSQSTLPLYFGLGDATAVTRIEVEWPSGVKQTVEGAINQLVDVVEPAE